MFADVNDTRLHCDVLGSGPPILFMHGGLGVDHSYFRPWLDVLARRHRLVFYDHRGNGRSSRSGSLDGATHDTFVEDAEVLRRLLGLGRIILFGHSYGACIALSYALRYPHHLRALVLASATPAFDYPDVMMEGAAARGTERQLRVLFDDFSSRFPDDGAFGRAYRTILPLYFHRPDPRTVDRVTARIRYSSTALHRCQTSFLPSFDVTAEVAGISTPTLILAGAFDWITPLIEGGLRLHLPIRPSSMVVFRRSGHFPFIEEPRRFASEVLAWLSAR